MTFLCLHKCREISFWLFSRIALTSQQVIQLGFIMLEVGSVSIKNTRNILIKNIGDACIGAFCWWLVGHGIAFGEDWGRFIGTETYFALKGSAFEVVDADGNATLTNGYEYAIWVFQWTFAATTSTMVSGAVAERIDFNAYIVYSIAPPLSSTRSSCTGPGPAAGPPHSSGKTICSSAAACSTSLGRAWFTAWGVSRPSARALWWAPAPAASIPTGRPTRCPSNPPCFRCGRRSACDQCSFLGQTLGILILWWGWYGFNGVSTLTLSGGGATIAAKVMVITTISAAFGAITNSVIGKVRLGYWDSGAANNGLLAGLVGITAGCSTCEPEAAMVIGIVAAFVYTYSSKLMLKLQIDDVVDAVPIHFFCGVWGVIAVSLFATKDNYANVYSAERADKCAGAFYGGDGSTLAVGLVFLLALIAWTVVTCMALFLGIKYTIGIRVSQEVEQIGMDDSKHGGQTYPEMVRKTLA
ncbi:ammonium transporter [Ectocarpus siliculosus]|uniref:Ammonium transporter n=1 Tax=Ectocarpus siliculosus TaxID=2880 RepID=D7G242_ECTSI|nr:ammonium transporter [Ectocarpus siliculosus]|eukprot:CBJ33345.1 ammonium transporter [Ectocarpus siliculosus]